MSWIDDLEARLDSQLQDFLRSNPDQEALLAEQDRRDRQEALRRQHLRLQQEAERSRADLLQLASEIRSWQERVQRARGAGATELAHRAEIHVAELMEQGRQRWQVLGELGQRFSQVEWELSQLEQQSAPAAGSAATPGSASTADAADRSGAARAEGSSDQSADLRDAWAAFEAQQELDALRQRLQR
ncbi:MAG: hercynine metabolism protein [Cyanobium sp.]